MDPVSGARTTRGASTLELLVATALAATLVTQSLLWTRTTLSALHAHDAAASGQRAAWLALEAMALDLRDAGFHAAGEPALGLAAARSDELHLVSDLDGDGTNDGSGEQVGYVFDGAMRILRRSTGNAAPQALTDPMPGAMLVILYFDAHGHPQTPGAAGLSPAQRAAVRRIELAFVDESTGQPRAQTSVHLRNPP